MARPKHRDSYLVCSDSRDQELPFPDFRDRKTQPRLSLPRWIRRDPTYGSGNSVTGATKLNHFQAFATEVETVRLSRPMWIRRYSGNGATQKAMAQPAWPARQKSAFSKLSRPRRRRRDFPDRGGDDATKNNFIATVVEAARLSRSEWRRRDFPEQGGDGATF